ncbi:MAG TPA: GtrA family protein [Ohtaekwangia sp.]|nr:GtrA family protein [Ohtaekwangia sp.]
MRALIKKTFTAEFSKFIIVGVVSALIEYSLFFLFKAYINYLIANIIAFGLTNIVTFVLTRRYVFNGSRNNKYYEATLFVICLAGALVVNQIVLWALVEFASTDKGIAKAIAIGLTVIWNFFTRKHVVFRNRQVAPERSSTKF